MVGSTGWCGARNADPVTLPKAKSTTITILSPEPRQLIPRPFAPRILVAHNWGASRLTWFSPHPASSRETLRKTTRGNTSPVPGSSLSSSPALGYGSVNGRGGGGGKATSRVQSENGESRPLLSLEAEDKKAGSGSSEPSLLFK